MASPEKHLLLLEKNKDDYVVFTDTGDAKLRRSLLECGNISVFKEVNDVLYNVPELFIG